MYVISILNRKMHMPELFIKLIRKKECIQIRFLRQNLLDIANFHNSISTRRRGNKLIYV